VMCLTSVLFMLVMRFTWHLPLWKVLPFILFLIVDGFFLAANVSKIPDVGWVSVMLATIFVCMMLTWHYGEQELRKAISVKLQVANMSSLKKDLESKFGVDEDEEQEEPVKGDIKSLNFKSFTMRDEDDETSSDSKSNSGEIQVGIDTPILPDEVKRLTGMGVFLSPSKTNVPTIFQLFVNYIHGVPEKIVFLTLEHVNIPFVPNEFKTEVTKHGNGVVRILARYGYSENKVKITEVMESAFNSGLERVESYTLFFNKEHITVKRKNLFLRFVLYVYSILKKFFSGSTSNFQLPSSSVMAVGVQVEL